MVTPFYTIVTRALCRFALIKSTPTFSMCTLEKKKKCTVYAVLHCSFFGCTLRTFLYGRCKPAKADVNRVSAASDSLIFQYKTNTLS